MSLTGLIGSRYAAWSAWLAACASFQSYVGAADATAALASIYVFRHAPKPAPTTGQPQSFAILAYPPQWDWQRDAAFGAQGLAAGQRTLSAELVLAQNIADPYSEAIGSAWQNAVDAILAELLATCSTAGVPLHSLTLVAEKSGILPNGDDRGYQLVLRLTEGS